MLGDGTNIVRGQMKQIFRMTSAGHTGTGDQVDSFKQY